MKKFFAFVTAALLAGSMMAAESMTCAQAREAALSVSKNNELYNNGAEYEVQGYVTNIAFAWASGSMSFWMADEKDGGQVLEAYKCAIEKEEDAVKVGDLVKVTGKLTKYNTTPEFAAGCTCEMIERGPEIVIEAEPINVARALEIGKALASGESTTKWYEVTGYVMALTDSKGVANEDGGWSTYHNQCMWIVDDKESGVADKDHAFFVYQGVPEEQVTIGAKVSLQCQIKNYNGMIENAAAKPELTIIEKGTGEPVPEADVTFLPADFKGMGTEQTGSEVTVSKDGVTITASKAFGHDLALRAYKNSEVSITSETEQIGKLKFSFAKVSGTLYDGGLDAEIVVNAKEWNATLASQARFEKIEVFFGEYEEPIEPEIPELPEGVLTVAQAVEAAAAIEEPTEKNQTIASEEVVKVRGWVTNAFPANNNNQQSAWLDDERKGSGQVQAYNLAIESVVAKGHYVEAEGKLAKFCKAAATDTKPAEIVIEIIDGSMTVIVGEIIEPEKLDTLKPSEVLDKAENEWKLADNGVTEKEYIIDGYVSKIDEPFSTYGNETFWIADDKESTAGSNAEGAFYVYRGKPTPAEEIGLHGHVYVKCKVKKYVKEGKDPVIENEASNCEVKVIEKGEEEVIESINVARAIEIGQALQVSDKDNKYPSEKRYEITGYVSFIVDLYDAEYGNETFWITDDPESQASSSDAGAFEVYRGKPNTKEEIGLGAKVKLVCNILNFNGTIENSVAVDVEVLEPGSITIEKINVAKAIEETGKLPAGTVGAKFYTVAGYVKDITSPYDSGFGNMSVNLTDDYDAPSASLQAFQCYRAKISADDAAKVEVGTYVEVTGHLDNNSHGMQMSSGSKMVLAPAPEIPVIDATVAEALEAGAKLADDAKSDETYRITGYVTYAGEYNEDDENQCFYLNDTPAENAIGIYAYWAHVPSELPSAMQSPIVLVGRLQKYIDEEDQVVIQVINGKVSWGEGIENVVLTEKAQKVVVDGVIYIIRDNKMFNLQGTQVR